MKNNATYKLSSEIGAQMMRWKEEGASGGRFHVVEPALDERL